MALIRCRECGKKISEYAESCPFCGFPTGNAQETSEDIGSLSFFEKKKRRNLRILISAAFFIIGMFLIIFPIAIRDEIEDDKKFDLYLDYLEDDSLQAELNDFVTINSSDSSDVIELLEVYMEDKIKTKVFLHQLPYFIFGAVSIIFSIYLIKPDYFKLSNFRTCALIQIIDKQ